MNKNTTHANASAIILEFMIRELICKRSFYILNVPFIYCNYRKPNMSYEIDIPDKIQRIIDKKLDKHLKVRFYKKLLKLELAPHSYAKPLRHPLSGIWEIYFEKRWRVLFEIHESQDLKGPLSLIS
jgi:mRNA-degrading endonuclease RelE of RelBE toxin-antitoxin system